MSDASDDPNGPAQGQNLYGNQANSHNKTGTTRLTVNEQQTKGNQCQC